VRTTAPAVDVSLLEMAEGDADKEHADKEQSLLASIRRDLDDVEAALAKLDEGAYGRCETCGEPLDEQRLATAPTERFCALHQPRDLTEGGYSGSADVGNSFMAGSAGSQVKDVD